MIVKGTEFMKLPRKGFTLIELLVVISIIALLVSILLPALSGAREQAKIAVCSVQMKQLATAVYEYATDHKDLLPPPGPRASYFFPTDSDGNYFAYFEYPWHQPNAGPTHLGYLILAGLIQNDANVSFCPGYKNPTFTWYQVTGRVGYNVEANSHGDPTHWNYAGVNAAGGSVLAPDTYPDHVDDHSQYRLRPEDEAKIGWINLRTGYSWRNLELLGIKTLAKGKAKAFVADVFGASGNGGNRFRSHIKQQSHVRGNATSATMNAGYLDGHIEARQVDRTIHFIEDNSPENGYFKLFPSVTWENLFGEVKYVD
jgi:prepilin-type N-terminal cleavage/methylation domain-containing protein